MNHGRQFLTPGVTALAPAIWGSTYLATAEWLPPDRPLLATTVRALPSGVILLLVSRVLPKGEWLWRSLVLGTLNIGAFNLLLFVAAYRLPGGVAAMIMSVQPMIVLILAALLIGDRIRPVHALACALGAAGVVLLVSKGSAALDTVGVAAGLGGAACMATGITFTKRWGRPEGVGLLPFTGWQLLAGGLVSLPFTLAVEGLPGSLTGTNVFGFAYLIVLGAVISYALWFRGIEQLPALAVSFLALGSPVVATVLGIAFEDESFSAPQTAGIVAVLVAVVLAQPRPAEPRARTPREQNSWRAVMSEQQRKRSSSAVRGWIGVAAITASLFVFLTTELMPVGLLTPLSESLDISVGTAGLMVTAQGVAAGLGVPFIVAWTRRVNRRLLLSALLAVLALGNLVTAVSPNYPLILATRLCMGFASGVFWAIGVSMAMRIVPERHASRAAAVVMSGISIATVVGIPLGTVVEAHTSWRTTFGIWAGLSLLVFLAVAAVIPSLPSQNAVSVREVFGLPVRNGQLRTVLLIVVFFVLGHFGAYTFVRPYLEDEAGAGSTFITVVLIIFGVGGAIGNFVAGYTAGRSLRGTFVVGLVGLLAALLLLRGIGDAESGAVAALVLWGLSFGAVQLSQVNMTLAAAPETFEAAMSLNTMAYNTCIALGALFGGLFVDHTGVTSVIWFGVILAAASLLLRLATGWKKRTPARPVPEDDQDDRLAPTA